MNMIIIKVKQEDVELQEGIETEVIKGVLKLMDIEVEEIYTAKLERGIGNNI